VLVFSTVLEGAGDSNLVASFRNLKLGKFSPVPCILVLRVFGTAVVLKYVSEVMQGQTYQSLCYSCNSCGVRHKWQKCHCKSVL